MLNVIVHGDYPNETLARVYQDVERDKFGYLNCNDSNLRRYFGDDFPTFCLSKFFSDTIKIGVYRGRNYLFIHNKIKAKDLGRVEHAIYHLTGKRGEAHNIDSLEILAPASSMLNKFLLKRL